MLSEKGFQLRTLRSFEVLRAVPCSLQAGMGAFRAAGVILTGTVEISGAAALESWEQLQE